MAADAVIFRSIYTRNMVQCFTNTTIPGFDKILTAQYVARSGMFENIIFLSIGQPVTDYCKGIRGSDRR